MAVTINGTTGIASVDASVAAPSIRGSDANSGISYGADFIKFSTGGVERTAITNTGYPRILQVVQNLITDTHSEALSTTHWATLGSFSNTTITPSASSSKILVSGWMSVGISSAMNVYLRLRRGSTVIGEADSAGDRRQGLSAGAPNDTNKMDAIPFWFLDSPSTTSATTYSVQLAHPSSSTRTIYINRDDTDTDATTGCRVCSSIVLQEVAA